MSNTRRRRPPRPNPGTPRSTRPVAPRDDDTDTDDTYEPPRPRTPRDRPARRRVAPSPAPEPADDEYDDSDEDYDEPYDDYDQEPAAARVRNQRDDAVSGRYVTVALLDEPMRIKPPGAWRQSAMRLLRDGNLDGFMDCVAHPADLDRYYDLDPTNQELGQMMADVNELADASQGKPHGPRPSSRRTRRR